MGAAAIPAAVVSARLSAAGQRNTRPDLQPPSESLAGLDDHLLTDIGLERERRMGASNVERYLP